MRICARDHSRASVLRLASSDPQGEGPGEPDGDGGDDDDDDDEEEDDDSEEEEEEEDDEEEDDGEDEDDEGGDSELEEDDDEDDDEDDNEDDEEDKGFELDTEGSEKTSAAKKAAKKGDAAAGAPAAAKKGAAKALVAKAAATPAATTTTVSTSLPFVFDECPSNHAQVVGRWVTHQSQHTSMASIDIRTARRETRESSHGRITSPSNRAQLTRGSSYDFSRTTPRLFTTKSNYPSDSSTTCSSRSTSCPRSTPPRSRGGSARATRSRLVRVCDARGAAVTHRRGRTR